jgi:integrase
VTGFLLAPDHGIRLRHGFARHGGSESTQGMRPLGRAQVDCASARRACARPARDRHGSARRACESQGALAARGAFVRPERARGARTMRRPKPRWRSRRATSDGRRTRSTRPGARSAPWATTAANYRSFAPTPFGSTIPRDPAGYKSRLQYSDADYFNLSDKDTRVATARREQKAPTLEQVKHVIATSPTDTQIERRNRALIAFTLLTGARDSAIASMKLKHVDLPCRLRLSRRSRGPYQVQQDVYDILFSGWGRGPRDRRRVGDVPA